jgi:hypothetical protein
MSMDAAADRYEFRLAVGGPFHAEFMRIPRHWDDLPTFASGAYRRVPVPAAVRHPCVGDTVLLHESVPAADVAGRCREAIARLRGLRPTA